MLYNKLPSGIFFFLFFLPLLNCSGGKNNGEEIPEIKKLANSLSEAEIDSIVNLPSEAKRQQGIIPVPQDFDDFRKKNLDTIFWNEKSIKYADFRGAKMRSAKCMNNDFTGSDFRASDIRWTIFDESILKKCNFDQAKLFHVKVNRAVLDSSTFRGTNMFGMEGHHASLRYCDFTGALMKDVEFIDADFTGSKAYKTRLIRAVFKGSKMDSINFRYADFTGGGLEKTSFKGAVLKHSNFQGASLQKADFSGADLQDVNFYGAHFDQTNFRNAKNIPGHIKEYIDEQGMAHGTVFNRKE